MQNGSADYYYNEYANKINDDNFVNIESNGMTYKFDIESQNRSTIDPASYRNAENLLGLNICEDNINQTETEKIYADIVEKKSHEELYCKVYFEQRPDAKIVYNNLKVSIDEKQKDIDKINLEIDNIKQVMLHEINDEIKSTYEELLSKKQLLESEKISYIEKKYKYTQDIYDYNNLIYDLEELNIKIYEFEQENPEVLLEISYEEIINSAESDNDKAYFSKLKRDKEIYLLLIEKKEIYEQKINEYISSSITLDDVSDELKNYNSSIGKVPAGEWDTWTNPYYEGYGYETGLTGAFEGPQGRETGYDSRKGDIKANYKDPDRALLKLLSEVTDKNGNILYPIESFEKGGEYYYHIFGVNDDGSINESLINNPRFGFKMLGDYFIVGVGPNSDDESCFNRQRGSKVMTSLGQAIVADYGAKSDLSTDLAHIDFNVDEVLFWLKNFSHNQDKPVESLAGIYDWCTPENFTGLIDENYEHMERNYVNNLNVTFNANYICIFDRDDFEDSTSYNSQDEFVYKLKF